MDLIFTIAMGIFVATFIVYTIYSVRRMNRKLNDLRANIEREMEELYDEAMRDLKDE